MMAAHPPPRFLDLTLQTVNIRGGSVAKTVFIRDLISRRGTVVIATETRHRLGLYCVEPSMRILAASHRPEHSYGGVAILCSPETARLLGPVKTASNEHGCFFFNRYMAVGGVYIRQSETVSTITRQYQEVLSLIRGRGIPIILGGDLNFCQTIPPRTRQETACQRGFYQVARQWRLALVPTAERPHLLAHRSCPDNFCTSGGRISEPFATLSPLGHIADHAFIVTVGCSWQPEGVRIPTAPLPSIPRFKQLRHYCTRHAFAVDLLGMYDIKFRGYPATLLGSSHQRLDPIPDFPHRRSPEGIRDFFSWGRATHGERFAAQVIDQFDAVLRTTLMATAERSLGVVRHTRAREHRPPGVCSDLRNEGDISHAMSAYMRHCQPPSLLRPREPEVEPDAVRDAAAFYAKVFAQHQADQNRDHVFWTPRCNRDKHLRPSASERFTDFPLDFVVLVIRASKSGTAPGVDNVPMSLLKALVQTDDEWKDYLSSVRNDPIHQVAEGARPASHPFLQSLTLLFRMCVVAQYTPVAWNESVIQPIAKEDSTDLTIDKCRPISLTLTFRRLFEKCLLHRCTEKDRNHPDLRPTDIPIGRFSRLQAGFRQGFSTMLHVLVADESLKQQPLSATLLDIKQAYDSVPVHRVLRLLKDRLGREYRPFVHLIESLFLVTSSSVRVNGITSPPFLRERGLFQGSLLSPMLFNVFIDPLARAIDECGQRSFPRASAPHALFYADDILILAMSSEETAAMVSLVEGWCTENFMTLNYGKCFTIPSTHDAAGDLQLPSNQVIKATATTAYLGAPLTNRGVDFSQLSKSFAERAKRVHRRSFGLPAAAGWSSLWRTIYAKIFVFSTMEYLAPLLWSHCEATGQFDLFKDFDKVIESCMCWILFIQRQRSGNRLQDPRVGFNACRSFLGLWRARDRAQYLAGMFNLHILSSHADNPVRALGVDLHSGARDTPDTHCSLLTPLLANPMWHVALETMEIQSRPLQEIPNKTKLREHLSIILRHRTVSLPPKRSRDVMFTQPSGTRQVVLGLPLCHKNPWRGPHVLVRVQDRAMQACLTRAVLGFWNGVSGQCPGCGDRFTMHHVDRCRLLGEELAGLAPTLAKLRRAVRKFMTSVKLPAPFPPAHIDEVCAHLTLLDAAVVYRFYSAAMTALRRLEGVLDRRLIDAAAAAPAPPDASSDDGAGGAGAVAPP